MSFVAKTHAECGFYSQFEAAMNVLHDAIGRPSDYGIAVSGGSDSLSMLYLASAWAKDANVRFHAVTVDHGLREEAAAEAEWVSQTANALGVPHDTLTWRPSVAASQADARTARHSLIAAWSKNKSISNILLGHTLNDRIETMMMRAKLKASLIECYKATINLNG